MYIYILYLPPKEICPFRARFRGSKGAKGASKSTSKRARGEKQTIYI